MAAGSASFHEAEEKLTPLTRDMHRAIVSLMEELEAVDWYQQRVDAAGEASWRRSSPQPGRGEGARGDGARVDSPSRPGFDEVLRDVPVHGAAHHGARAGLAHR